jgi:hypothetical protein
MTIGVVVVVVVVVVAAAAGFGVSSANAVETPATKRVAAIPALIDFMWWPPCFPLIAEMADYA